MYVCMYVKLLISGHEEWWVTALNRLTVERSNNGGKDVAPNEAKITIISHSTAMAKSPDISDK